MRLAIALLSLIGLADAKIDFVFSTLFDEYDLTGNKEIPLDQCNNGGCSVFVSASDRTMEATKSIFVFDPVMNVNYSIYDLASGYDKNTGKLKGLNLGGKQYKIRNYYNGNIGPIVIYNVASQAPLYPTNYVELFDGLRMARPDKATPYVTILSSEPYDLFVRSTAGPLTVFVRATGFDANSQRQAFNDDQCQIIHDQNSNDPFRLHINSPIITVAFEAAVTSQICTHPRVDNGALLDYQGIATSPGYVGCKNGQVFRSSGYPSNSFDLHDSKDVDRTLDIDYSITTMDKDKVQFTIYATNAAPFTWSDQGANKMVRRTDRAYKMIVALSDNLGSSYLVKFNPQVAGSVPTGEGVCSNWVADTTVTGSSTVSSTAPTTTTSGAHDVVLLTSIAMGVLLVRLFADVIVI